MRETEIISDIDDALRMHCNPLSRPWAPNPNSLDIVVKLHTVRMTAEGIDCGTTDALIKHGFAIANITVMEIEPSSLTFFVRLWRHTTDQEKQLNRTGSLALKQFV